MQNKYFDFIKEHTRYRKLRDDKYFQEIFDFLSKKEILKDMIDASEHGKPALSGCIEALLDKFPDLRKDEFKTNYNKQAIGFMVKVILEPFGYEPIGQKRMPSTMKDFFSSASAYKLKPEKASLKLVQNWDIVESDKTNEN